MHRREWLFGAMAMVTAARVSAQLPAPAPVPSGARPAPPPLWGPGYAARDLRNAEQRFGIRFPPDLLQFLLQRRFARSPDWTKDEAAIRELLAWPLDSILLDIERYDFWAPHWGPRPDALERRIATATRLVRAAPRLIPLAQNTYMPETPSECGNPVFFLFLSDIRYRAADLADYVARISTPGGLRQPVTGTRKPIPFWTEMTKLRPAPRKRP